MIKTKGVNKRKDAIIKSSETKPVTIRNTSLKSLTERETGGKLR